MKSRGNYKGYNSKTFNSQGEVEKARPNPNAKVWLSVFKYMANEQMSDKDKAFVEDMIVLMERLVAYEENK